MSLVVRNLMEDIAERKLESLLPSLNVCDCEICKTDILCYALNRLKPKYVATTQGELLSRIDSLSSSFDMSVVAELANAAEIVKKHPRHK